MNCTGKFSWVIAPLALALLILDTQTALVAANDGINMCIRSVVPSLFPFIIISTCATNALIGRFRRLLRPVGRLCKIPDGCESLLLTGFLGGYPVGAQCVSEVYRAGAISRRDAERMVVFCNNAGPAFIFGIVGALFSDQSTTCVIWGIQILSALIVGMILPGSVSTTGANHRNQNVTLVNAIKTSTKTMANICGFVLFFRVIMAYAKKYLLLFLPQELSIMLSSFLELTNGCLSLSNIVEEADRFIICSAILSFGGLCIMLQTAAVAGEAYSKLYFPGKLLHCCISIMLSVLSGMLIFGKSNPHPYLLIFSTCLFLLLTYRFKRFTPKKSIAFSRNMIYNGKKSYI